MLGVGLIRYRGDAFEAAHGLQEAHHGVFGRLRQDGLLESILEQFSNALADHRVGHQASIDE